MELDPLLAKESDQKNGRAPIHIAAASGALSIVKVCRILCI